MPNRIIKDSIRTSKKVNLMTDFQFRLWVNLITYVDDYGRGSADPELLKGFVFPRRKSVTEGTIEKAMRDLANMGLILLYDVDGDSYFCFPSWTEHQRIQTKKSKFPAPDDGDIVNSTVSHGESRTESNPNPESKSRIQNPENDAHEAFEAFWKAYPRKAGSKQKAFESFKKAGVPLETMLNAIEEQKKSAQWSKDNGQFIPHPTTWLNGKRWNDEMTGTTVPCGALGQLGEAEEEAIRRVMAEDIPDLPYNF